MGIRDKLNELDYLDRLAQAQTASSELASRQWIVTLIGWVELILGIAVYFMLAFFTIIVILDIIYFNVPPVQGWVDKLHDENAGKKKFTKFLVSQRAKLSMDKSYITGQNVSIIYIIKIFPMFIMVSIALAYVLTDLNIVVTDFMWNMADLLVDMLDSWSR